MQLRYRLMPYLYSLTGAVHFEDYTLMRGLPMDYPADPEVRDLSDQWMLGPALMCCPVYEYQARSRCVYFPEGRWYDFYTGESIEGGRRLCVAAPYERIPLYVRAGSILPLGPDMEWSDQKPADPLTLLIYPGADAHFTLYEDDGLSYGYEKGQYATIGLHWDDAGRTLRIDDRQGAFPGMLQERVFDICLKDPARPASRQVRYDGKSLTVKL